MRVVRLARGIVAALLWAFAAIALRGEPLEALVLLDESGSMYGNARARAQDAGFDRYAAIQCLVQKLRPGDSIGVAPFGTVQLADATVAPKPVSRLGDGDWKSLARIGAEGAGRQYSTNYAGALRAAIKLLGAPKSSASRIVILLSDGVPNEPGNSPAELRTLSAELRAKTGARLYTLGFGPDVELALLKDMAAAADGRDFAARSAAELPFLFARIIREAAAREVRTPPDRAAFVIGPGARELRAIAVDPGEGPPFALIGPDGTRHSPQVETPIYAAGQANRVHALRIESPQPGRWRLEGDPAKTDIGFESSLRVAILAPADGEAIPNAGKLAVTVRADGASPDDELRGAVTLRTAEGPARTLKLSMGAAIGKAEFDVEEAPAGPAELEARIWRSFAGEEEEGVPARIGLSLVEAPPGVPAVVVEWPSKNDHYVGAGDRVKVTVGLTATREARGRKVQFVAPDGWRIDGPATVTLGKRQTVVLTLRGPYEGARGEFRPELRVVPGDPMLQVTGAEARTFIRARNWIDTLLIVLRLSLPLILALMCFGLWVAAAWVRWKLIRRLRTKALDSIEVIFGGNDVARVRRRSPSNRVRTFGGEKEDVDLAFDETPQAAPERPGEEASRHSRLLTAEIPGRQIVPKMMRYRAINMKLQTSDEFLNEVEVAHDVKCPVSLLDADGRYRAVDLRFRYDRGLALRVEFWTKAMYVLGALFVIAGAWTAFGAVRDWDQRTFERQASIRQESATQFSATTPRAISLGDSEDV